MNFKNALILMQHGHKMRQKSWLRKDAYVWLCGPQFRLSLNQLNMPWDKSSEPFVLTVYHLTAIDWEEYKKET